jgi:flavoprotein
MQYILTQEEYYSLVDNKKVKLELCITVCNTMPIKKYDNTLSPWGCIFDKKNWYCDKCPVQEICPYENKNWSK